MKKDGKIWQFLGCIALILLVSSSAQAGVIAVTGPFAFNAFADWGEIGVGLGQCVGTHSGCSPAAVSTLSNTHTGGNTLTMSFSDTLNGIVFQQNAIPGTDTYNGSFPPNQFLLNSSDSGLAADTLTISFLNPISAFGVYVEEFDGPSASFQASISTADDGGGTYTAPSHTGTAEFVGLADSGGSAFIHSITISTIGADAGYFLIGTADFNGNATVVSTPEPGATLLMVGGLAALVWKARQRARA